MKGTAVDLVLCVVFFGAIAVLLAVMYYLERSLDAPVGGAVGQTGDRTQPQTSPGPVDLVPAEDLSVGQLAGTPSTR